MILDSWLKYKLGELYDICPETSRVPETPGTPCLYLTPGKISENTFLPSQTIPFSDIADKNLNFLPVRKGDIFWAVQQEKNMTSVALQDYPVVAVSRSVKQLRLKKQKNVDVDPLFIAYYLRSSSVYNQIARYSSASSRFGLIDRIINDLEIRLPLLKTQVKTGEMLKSLDDKISNNLKMNRTLHQIAHTLFSEWFFLTLTPEGWVEQPLESFCKLQTGYPFKSGDYNEKGDVGIIKITNICEAFADTIDTDFVDSKVVESLDKKYKVQSNSLLIAMSGSDIGKVALVPPLNENKQLWLNQRTGMFKEEIPFGNFFLYLLLSTDAYQSLLRNSAFGSAQLNISATTIEKIRIITPPAGLIEQFGRQVYPMFERILANNAENEKLEVIRNQLLRQLISGKITTHD